MKRILVLGALALAATSLAGCVTDSGGRGAWRHHHHGDRDHDHDHDGDHHDWNGGYGH